MLKIAFLGGLGDFGKNLTVLDQDGDLLVVDCGSQFPESDFPGVDLVIPDFSYIADRAERLRGIVLTHGHEDHIGAAGFLLRVCPAPLFGTAITLGLAGRKIRELGAEAPRVTLLEAGKEYSAGPFRFEGIPVTHSVPDAVSLLIRTPDATLVHTGDFKFDQAPIDGRLTHYHRFQEAGRAGVTAMLIDSTNVEVEGMVGSETRVRQTLERYVAGQTAKIFVALFSTNLMRVQVLFDLAARYGRKVALFGRSLSENVRVGQDVGYLRVPEGVVVAPEDVPDLPRETVIVLTSGSQAEPFSALSRIAFDENKNLFVEEGDLLILSARIIPGNEKRVARVVNQIYRNGGEVVTSRDDRVHVSGHAAQEEIRLMTSWVRPTYYVPVHGEFRQLKGNARLAEEMGYERHRILLAGTGDALKFEKGAFAGREEVPAGSVLIDGDSADPVDRLVVRDRRHISTGGVVVPIVVVNRQTCRMEADPEIISRGYSFLDGENGGSDEIRREIAGLFRGLSQEEIRDDAILKAKVKSAVKRVLKRNEAGIPLIIPVVMGI
ncbi:MAG: ribonuclease J [Acidobacteriota bacterium]